MTVNDSQTPAQATETETPPEFHIDSENAANWYLRKLANIESEKQRVTMQAAQIVKQLEADAEGLRYCFDGELEAWTRQELAKKGNRRKSLILLQGTLQFRTVPAGVKLADLASATHYATAVLPDLVKTTPTLDTLKYRSVALTALAKTGELLPGIEQTPEREAFTVKFGSKAE